MNKLGTHIQVWKPTWTPSEVEEAAKKASALGYHFLEVPIRAPETVDVTAIKAILDAYDMTCVCPYVHAADLDIATEDESVRIAAVAKMKKGIDCAAALGAKWITGPTASALGKFDIQRTDLEIDNSARSMAELAEYAKQYGINICIEALNRYENNLINTAKQGREFVDKVGADNLYVQLDSFHMNIEESDIRGAILTLGDRLGYIQVAENYRGYLGTGEFNFTKLFRALAEIDYQHFIGLEVFSSAVSEPAHSGKLAIWRETWSNSEDIAQHAFRYIEQQTEDAKRYHSMLSNGTIS
ncbi:sugar phosphate isomerase/epimerase family protein [Vibrio cionasavignyae]|uniref:sugar phosphate isomerase/epimerase family protein n=1 Tax=Vibrio cionasavignyae TaxID=2910252 RepID=UPI003D131BB5